MGLYPPSGYALGHRTPELRMRVVWLSVASMRLMNLAAADEPSWEWLVISSRSNLED